MPGLYGQAGQQVGQQVGMPGLYGQAGQQVGQQVGMPGLYGQYGQQVGLSGFYGQQVGPPGPSGQQTQQGPSQHPSQAVIQTTQPNVGGTRQGIADVVLAEIEEGGMLSLALEEMEYADVMQWAKEKQKRVVSEGELSASRPRTKRPVLEPVGRGIPGQAILEEDLAGRPSAPPPTNLEGKKSKKKRRHPKDKEPI